MQKGCLKKALAGEPGAGDEHVAGGGGVDTVAGPGDVGAVFFGLKEGGVKRGEGGLELCGEVAEEGDVGGEFFVACVGGRRGDDGGLAEDDAGAGMGGTEGGEEVAHAGGKCLKGSAGAAFAEEIPDVVDADLDGNKIGGLGEDVAVPPLLKLIDAIAGDAHVDDMGGAGGIEGEEPVANEADVARAEEVGTFPATAISDAVADENPSSLAAKRKRHTQAGMPRINAWRTGSACERQVGQAFYALSYEDRDGCGLLF